MRQKKNLTLFSFYLNLCKKFLLRSNHYVQVHLSKVIDKNPPFIFNLQQARVLFTLCIEILNDAARSRECIYMAQ